MNQKGLTPIIIILITLAVLGIVGGAYYFGTLKNTKSQNPITASNLAQSPTTNPVNNWKTYINPTFGYSINFPDTYEVPVESDKEKSQLGVDTNMCVVSKSDGVCQIVLSVFPNNENLSLENWLAKNEKSEVTGPLLPYTFNGYGSLLVKNQPGTNIFIAYKSNIYQINTPTASSNKEIATILSTFKFTQ